MKSSFDQEDPGFLRIYPESDVDLWLLSRVVRNTRYTVSISAGKIDYVRLAVDDLLTVAIGSLEIPG